MYLICDVCHNKIFLNDTDRKAETFRCPICGKVIPATQFESIRAERMLWLKRKTGKIIGPVSYDRLHKMIFTRRAFGSDEMSFEGRNSGFVKISDYPAISSIFNGQSPSGTFSPSGAIKLDAEVEETELPVDKVDLVTPLRKEPAWANEPEIVAQVATPEPVPIAKATPSRASSAKHPFEIKSILIAVVILVFFIGLLAAFFNLDALKEYFAGSDKKTATVTPLPPPLTPPVSHPPEAQPPPKDYSKKDIDKTLADPNATSDEKVKKVAMIVGLFIDSKNYQDAIESLKKAFDYGLIDAKLYKLMVYVYRLQGRDQTAIDALNNAVKHSPDNPEIVLELAESYRRAHDPIKEQGLLLKFLENNKSPEFSERLGDLMALQKRIIEAESYFNDALKEAQDEGSRKRIGEKLKNLSIH